MRCRLLGYPGNRTIKATGRPQAGSLLFAALLAVTIAFQGWMIQTHVHADGFAAAVTTAQNAGKAHQPVNDDPAKCPICQEMAHSGLFTAPAWLAFFLVVATSSIVALALFAAPTFTALSHAWHSRGPPRV